MSATKVEMDIEMLLRWAFRDELSKRACSAAEGIWDRIQDNQHHGGIDRSHHGAGQRYAAIGLPDPDAERIEKAVTALEEQIIDWNASMDAIAGDLGGLITINDVAPSTAPKRVPRTGLGTAGDRALKGMFGPGAERPPLDRPRDIIMMAGIRTDVLVATRTQAGTLTAGNNTVTGLTSTSGFGSGMPVEGTGVQAGTTILSVTATTIVMSTTATANGAQNITVFTTGYGSGGDTTTVGVKNCVGKVVAGLDPSATSLDAASAFNAAQGVKSRQIPRNALPSLQLGVSVSGNISVNTQVTNIVAGTPTTVGSGNLGNVDVLNAGSATAGIRLSTGANSMTGNTDNLNGGVSQAQLPTVQPTVTAECVVAVLP